MIGVRVRFVHSVTMCFLMGIESLPHKKNRKPHKKKLYKNAMTKPHKI
jgi:hypothetical protein